MSRVLNAVISDLRSLKKYPDQRGINMVDLMMWLVIAALILSAAIQGIGYYHKAALVYQLSSDVSAAGTNVIKEAATANGKVTPAVAEAGVMSTEKSDDLTVVSKSVAPDGYFIVLAAHPDVTDYDVVYSSAERNGLHSGVNLIPKGSGVQGLRIPNFGQPINGECSDGQWKGEYFNNKDLAGTPVGYTCEDAIHNQWGQGAPKVEGMNSNQFSVRWTTKFVAATTGQYEFRMQGDDGSRVLLDDVNISDRWGDTAQMHNVTREVPSGEHKLVVEYRENNGNAAAIFTYKRLL